MFVYRVYKQIPKPVMDWITAKTKPIRRFFKIRNAILSGAGKFQSGAVFVPDFAPHESQTPLKFILSSYAAVVTLAYPLATLAMWWLKQIAMGRLSLLQANTFDCCDDEYNWQLFHWASKQSPDVITAFYVTWHDSLDNIESHSWPLFYVALPILLFTIITVEGALLEKLNHRTLTKERLLKSTVISLAVVSYFLVPLIIIGKLCFMLSFYETGVFGFLFDNEHSNSFALEVIFFVFANALRWLAYADALRYRQAFITKYDYDMTDWRFKLSWKYWFSTFAGVVVAVPVVALLAIPYTIYAFRPAYQMRVYSDRVVFPKAVLNPVTPDQP